MEAGWAGRRTTGCGAYNLIHNVELHELPRDSDSDLRMYAQRDTVRVVHSQRCRQDGKVATVPSPKDAVLPLGSESR